MLNKLKISTKLKSTKDLKTSKSVIDTFQIPKNEQKIVGKHISLLILQSINNFFVETGRIAEISKPQKTKKYSRIESNDTIALFPFLGNESNTGYNKVVVFSAYCDLLQYLISNKKSKEIISSVLNNIRIIYFQNPSEIKSLLMLCTPIVESALQHISSSHESANSYFSSFGDTHIPADASTHTIYFKEMLTKQPFYTSRKFLAFGLAGLGLIGYFINQGENTTANNVPSRGPIVDNIEYPRNTDTEDTIHNKLQPIPKNGALYTHQASGISILPVKNEEEYYVASSQSQVGVSYNQTNEYSSISTTVSESHLKIDREITKNQLYKIISLLRKNKKYNMNDVTYGLADEIRVEDLPEGVAGLFKNWSDNPTDKDIYLDTDLVNGGTQIEQEWVLIHEFIHSVIGTSSSTLRNEGITEALTQRSFYESRNIDLFNFNDPYSPHVLDFIMINNVYGSGYDGFEHFDLELVYNYQDLSNHAVNPEYASGLRHILSHNPKSIINPIVIAFFSGGLDGIVQAKKHFLCTPGTKKGFDLIQSMYKESILFSIEQDNDLTTVEKVQKAIDYFEANKGTLSAVSPHDELPGNKVNVNFDPGKTGQKQSRGGTNQEDIGTNQEDIGTNQEDKNNTGNSIQKDEVSNSERNNREGNISRQDFLEDLALNIVVAGADGRLGIRLDEERYPWHDGKIDPQYFRQQIRNIIKNRIESEITENGNWELTVDEQVIVEDILTKNFQKNIPSLAQSFEREIKSDQSYKYWTESNFDFLDGSNSRGLQGTSERVVDEYLESIDITSLIINQDNFYDIINIISQQHEKGGDNILSGSLLNKRINEDLETYYNETDVSNKVPFFEEKYMSIEAAAQYLSLEYYELVKSNGNITYTFKKDQTTINMIKDIMQEKNIGIIGAIKAMLLEQNQDQIAIKIKQSKFYQEAIHRYTDPLGKDQNYFLKKIYDILNFVDKNKKPFFWITNLLLLIVMISYLKNRQRDKNTTKRALSEKYKLYTNDISENFPIHDYIARKEKQHTISSTNKKLRILNGLLLIAFVLGWHTTNMIGYKRNVLHESVERYKNVNPKRTRTPHTYQNLLLIQNSKLNSSEMRLQIERSYQTDNDVSGSDSDSYIKSYYWSFPFQPPLTDNKFEPTITQEDMKQVTNVYKRLVTSNTGSNTGSISATTTIKTHQKIRDIIGNNSHLKTEKELSNKGLRGAILLTIGSLTSLLLLAYNTSTHLKKINAFRKQIGKLISLSGLHSINERNIDLIMTNDDNLNDLIWKKIEYHFGGLTTIRELEDVAHLLSSVNIPGEKLDQLPFTCQVKNLSTFDREALCKIAYQHIGEEQLENIKGYNHMIINYERRTLLPGSENTGVLKLYESNMNDLYNKVTLNFIEYYLPRIIIAQVKGRSIETYINRLPYSEKVTYFTNVRLIKSGLPKDEEVGEIQTNGFNINSIMTPQVYSNSIKQPTSSSAIIVGW